MADTPTGEDLLAIAAGGWGSGESQWLDGWLMRASEGFTHRANSVWPVGPLNRPLPDALKAVRAWYAQRGLSAWIQTVSGSKLDRQLEELGHARTAGAALRQTAAVEDVLDVLLSVAPLGVKESFSDGPTDDWLALWRTGEVPPIGRTVLGSGASVQYMTVYDAESGKPLAIGRTALAARPQPQGSTPAQWASLAALETVPAARRRGLAKLVMDGLLEWAQDHGAQHVFLEVTEDNAPALALYKSLGFSTDHAYHCRVLA